MQYRGTKRLAGSGKVDRRAREAARAASISLASSSFEEKWRVVGFSVLAEGLDEVAHHVGVVAPPPDDGEFAGGRARDSNGDDLRSAAERGVPLGQQDNPIPCAHPSGVPPSVRLAQRTRRPISPDRSGHPQREGDPRRGRTGQADTARAGDRVGLPLMGRAFGGFPKRPPTTVPVRCGRGTRRRRIGSMPWYVGSRPPRDVPAVRLDDPSSLLPGRRAITCRSRVTAVRLPRGHGSVSRRGRTRALARSSGRTGPPRRPSPSRERRRGSRPQAWSPR